MGVLRLFGLTPERTCTIRRKQTAARAALIWLLTAMAVLQAQPAPQPEYALKAVFLFNFAKFVEWPGEAFTDEQAPIVIGVLGEDPFGQYLDETVRGEQVSGRSLTVQRFRTVEEIGTCHILFISRSESVQIETILDSLRARSILTVSDGLGSSWQGSMIRFASEDNKIRLKINVAAAEAVGLKISSKLLKLADIVAPGKD